MNPTVSVIMPVYNAADFLAEAVASILQQSFGDFELILGDDASQDGSRALAAGFRDPRIVRFSNARNLGVARTLNNALVRARGRFIARMDADDVAHPERLARQVAFLSAQPALGLVGCDVILTDAAGRETGREIHPHAAAPIARAILRRNPFAHSTILMRADLLRRWGGYDPRFGHTEDYDLWLRLHARGVGMANLAEFLLRRRVHPAAITQARQRQVARDRFLTLAHAVCCYYRNPLLAGHLLRPAAAYLYRCWP